MLSIDEFNSADAAYTRLNGRRVLIVAAATVGTMFACFAVVALYRDSIRNFLVETVGASAAEIVMGFTSAPAVFVLFGGLLVFGRLNKQDSRLICPSCNKSLLGMTQLVVATRNCGHCGKRILAEPDGPHCPPGWPES
jgi:hypothetical protein